MRAGRSRWVRRTGRWLGTVAGLIALAVGLAGCTGGSRDSVAETGPLTLVSSAFPQQGSIPIDFSCSGADTAPPLAWHGAAPSGTSSWALVMTDLDVVPAPWIQWLVTGIPAGTRSVTATAMPPGAVSGHDSSGAQGFVGACPPTGAVHHYAFTLYAIGGQLSVAATAPAADAFAAIVKAAVGHASLVGRFAR